MKEKIRKLSLVTLLGLAVVIAGVWVTAQFFEVTYRGNRIEIQNSRHSLWWDFRWSVVTQLPPPLGVVWSNKLAIRIQHSDHHGLLPNFEHDPVSYECNVPFWLVILVALLVAAPIWFFRPRPFNPLRCETCNYNLAANTTGVCPECGTAIVKTLAPATQVTPPGDA